MFYNVSILVDQPNQSTECVWVANATLQDENVKKKFALQTLGAYALNYAERFKLKPPSPIKDFFKIELTNDEGEVVTTMRLVLQPSQNRDDWTEKNPDSNGLWFYVGIDDEGEEIVGVALIELEKEFPIQATLGDKKSYQFGDELFIGPWKKIQVPVPPGWTSDKNDIYTKNPMVIPKK